MKTLFKIIALTLALVLLLSSCALRDANETTAKEDSPSDSIEANASVNADTDSPASADTTHVESQPATFAPETAPATESETVPTEPAETELPATEGTSAPVTEAPETTAPDNTVTPQATYRPKVFMYHLILDEVYGIYENLFVRPSDFDKQLTMLDSLGYEYLFAEEWQEKTNPTAIITLDDGYLDNYTEMFPILKAHGAKATVFLVSDLIGTDGYMTREMIKEMSDSGLVSFQCHTVNHCSLKSLSAADVRYQVTESSRIIEEITGKPVRAIAYPAGEFNDTVISVVSETLNFAYTTKSPNSVKEYTEYTVPRYYVDRYMTEQRFRNMLY